MTENKQTTCSKCNRDITEPVTVDGDDYCSMCAEWAENDGSQNNETDQTSLSGFGSSGQSKLTDVQTDIDS